MKTYLVKFLLVSTFSIAGLIACSGAKEASVSSTSHTFPNYETAAVDAHFDANKIAKLEARMEQFVADGDVAGIATLLVKDGLIISHKQAGLRRASDEAPITNDTIYRIYSMTKPITGVAMMQLYEDGKFELDDPISKFIPEFEGLQVVKSYEDADTYELEPLNRQPTMKELMSHTAGFAYWLGGNDPSNHAMQKLNVGNAPDLDVFIKTVANVPLIKQPGEMWFYSASVDIQGAIIERLTGMTLGDYFQTEIFDPLKMTDTGFYVPEANYDRFSDVFYFPPETGELTAAHIPSLAFKKDTITFESGGGGLVSTLGDYARFCQMLANGGELDGVKVMTAESIKLMRTNVLTDSQKVLLGGDILPATRDALGFGLNFGTVNSKPGGDIKQGDGTYFWGGAAGTWFWIDPTHDLFFIGMIQRFPQNRPKVDFRGISRDLVYEALIDRE